MIKFFRIISIILTVTIMIIIFCFSAQNAEESTKTSSGFISNAVQSLYPDFSKLSEDKQDEIISGFQFTVRKLAHFTIYFALGISAFMSFISYSNIRFNIRIIMSAAVCIIYAASDEIHQLFVDGRSCEFRDFMIDSVGSLLGILLGYLLFIVITKRRQNNA